MARCGACGTIILFGGVTSGGLTFCNNECAANGYLAATMPMVPENVVEQHSRDLHGGACPECQSPGPIDVHVSHRIVSFVVMTRWSTHPHICCRACARQHNWSAIASSSLLGWWGFPWGILGTPVQIMRNFREIFRSSAVEPSEALREHVRAVLAACALQEMESQAAGQSGEPAGHSVSPPPLPNA